MKAWLKGGLIGAGIGIIISIIILIIAFIEGCFSLYGTKMVGENVGEMLERFGCAINLLGSLVIPVLFFIFASIVGALIGYFSKKK